MRHIIIEMQETVRYTVSLPVFEGTTWDGEREEFVGPDGRTGWFELLDEAVPNWATDGHDDMAVTERTLIDVRPDPDL